MKYSLLYHYAVYIFLYSDSVNPEKRISPNALLKLELYANIPILTQLCVQQKLGPLKERAGFSQSQMPLPLAGLYCNISPAVNCIRSWVDDNSPSLQPTWKIFIQTLREPQLNLGKTAGQIETYLQISEQETELSGELQQVTHTCIVLCVIDDIINNPIIGMEELEVLKFQIESLQYRFTTTSKDEEIISKLERLHKRHHLTFYKLRGDQQRLMQSIEHLQNQIGQLIHQKSML